MDSLSSIDVEIDNQIQELSKLNIHPWDELVQNLFGKDYIFPTFDDVEIPKDFDIQNNIPIVNNIQDKLQQSIFNSLSSILTTDLESVYKSPFINKDGTYNENKYKEYIKLLQMITDIPEDSLDNGNTSDILTKKMLHEYIRIFKD